MRLRLEPEMTFVDHQPKIGSRRALLDNPNNTCMESTSFMGHLDRVGTRVGRLSMSNEWGAFNAAGTVGTVNV